MVISVREFFYRGGLFEFLAFIFKSKQRKCKNAQSIKHLPLIDKIDELVGLNILPANFIENLLPPRYKQQHENSNE